MQMLRRDRLILIIGLFVITFLSWTYTIYLTSVMPGMDMDMMNAAQMASPNTRGWQLADFGFNFVMWTVMMVAMMTPTAAPMVLAFASVARQRDAQHSVISHTSIFLIAYLIIWLVFSLAATILQWRLYAALLLTDPMMTVGSTLGGIIFILAGIYQFTPLKHACLFRCRTPVGFLLSEGREGTKGALMMGLRHGAFCVGCCWLLMLLLFVAGVMNLLWIALISIFVLVEKAVPTGHWIGRVAGVVIIVWGVVLLFDVL